MDPALLRSVVRAAIELTSRHDRAEVLDTLLGELERHVPYDMAAVLVLDGDSLAVLAGRGFRRDLDLSTLRFTLGENPRLDRALGSRGTVRYTDAREPDPFDGKGLKALHRVHSCMAAPMRVGGELLGAVTADAFEDGRFEERHAELLELFAALAGVAIRNADLISELERARSRLQGAVATLQEEIRTASGGTEIIGGSPPSRALREEIGIVGPTDTSVLILGETGTGKELVARSLHALSRRRDRPLIRFDASAVAPSLIEAELYGHAKGAFTGAVAARPGRFEVADGGTLFLDEIGELPLELQPRLLRALQEREVERVGEARVRKVDVRVIAATNRDLEAEVRAGRFRADLFHRLAVYPIRVPPLRERLEDVPELVDHFARKLAPRLGLDSVAVDEAFSLELMRHSWPGNVRELENAVERVLVRARAQGRRKVRLDRAAARDAGGGGPSPSPSPRRREALGPKETLKQALERFQLEAIEGALAEANGNLAAAAKRLGEDRSNLHRRLRRLRGPRQR